MAKNKIVGITIDIEGKNSGLTKSLQEVNRDLNKTTSALKDVNKALELDPTNVELLAQKEELLNKQVEETNEKLRILKDVAADAAKGLEDGTVSREQYASLTAEIVKTEAGLRDLTGTADQAGEAMGEVVPENADQQLQSTAENAKNTGISFDDLAVAAAAAGPAIGTALAIIAGGASILLDIAGAAMEAAEAVGGFLVDAAADAATEFEKVLEKLSDFTVEAGDYADTLHTLEQTTGINAKTLQELDYALGGLVDVSLEQVTGTLKKMTKGLDDAGEKEKAYLELKDELDKKLQKGRISQEDYNEQLEKASTAYINLGVSVLNADGSLRSSYDVFLDTIDALASIENKTERDSLAMSIMGKSASDLGPLFSVGSSGLRMFADEAARAGYILSDDQLDRYQKFDDTLERLDNGVTAAKNALGLVLLPLLSDLATDGVDLLGQFNAELLAADGDISKVSQAITNNVPKMLEMLLKNAPQAISLTGDLITGILGVIRDNSGPVLEAVFDLVEMVADSLLSPESIEDIFESIRLIIGNVVSFFNDHGAELLSIGVMIVTELVNGLASTMPILAPAAANAIVTIVQVLTSPENINAILGSAALIITSLATALGDNIDVLKEAIPPLVDAICSVLETLMPLITDAGIMVLGALLEAEGDNENISKIIEVLAPKILELMIEIGKKIIENEPEITNACIEVFEDLAAEATTWGSDLVANFIDGMLAKAMPLAEAAGKIAAEVSQYIHFSKPDVGPLSDADQYGGDLVDLFADGIEKELPYLQESVNLMASTIAGGSSTDYSGQLAGIDSNLSAIAGADRQIIIPVYLGSEHIDTIVARANVSNNYISGGR